MNDLKLLRMAGLTIGLAVAAVIAVEELEAYSRDLWVHPRTETFDPERHYKGPSGEIYYKHERQLTEALGDISVDRVGRPLISVGVGPDLVAFAEERKGSLVPVILFDSDGDGAIDRMVRGRMKDGRAVFDSPRLGDLDLRSTEWQLGVRYAAGSDGDPEFDGRYLASVDSQRARVAYRRIEELAPVGAGPAVPGLVIFKHREGVPFDFAEFVEHPSRYMEDFDRLTRREDEDDWTVADGEGRLVTHLDREDLFLIRTEGGLALDVEWGDMPLVAYLEDELDVRSDTDGCYSSIRTGLRDPDGGSVVVPHRLLYCPEDSVALFDAPPGYQIGLTAEREAEAVERTEVSNSIRDNFRLYMREINPRSPSSRSTGTVSGNIRAGFKDAGADLTDALRYTFTGTNPRHIHTGQETYRPSPIVAVPRTLMNLAALRPLTALSELATGVDSAVRAGASVVSAVDNSLVNPALQLTVGLVSTGAADTSGDWIGAVAQSAAKNFPGGERSIGAVDPFAAWHHNRAFAPVDYTRTDTQLNFDRVMTTVDVLALRAIDRHNDDSGGGGSESADQNSEPGANSGGGRCRHARRHPGRHHGKGHHVGRRHAGRHHGKGHHVGRRHATRHHPKGHHLGRRHTKPPHPAKLSARRKISRSFGAAFKRVRRFCGFSIDH
jgi:hypothetical protein